MRKCEQCDRELPDADFFRPVSQGWKCNKGNDCAAENMRKWAVDRRAST